MGSESQTEPRIDHQTADGIVVEFLLLDLTTGTRCLGSPALRVNGRDVALELKESPCVAQVEASACCTPERQASCCEPAAKADCCAPSAVGSCGCQ